MHYRVYRDGAELCVQRGRLNGISEPEAVVPISAHPAFAKACEFLSVKLVLANTLPSGHVDVRQVRQLTTSNTVLIVGSAPQFAQGTIDDIASLATFAQSRDIGMHVDCCLGGFLLPWLVQLGHIDARFDFQLPGVTSISTDIHKYGFGAKGASVILFRNSEWRRLMFTAYTEWNGGMYCSPTMTGSRSGGVIASTYATLMLMVRASRLMSTIVCAHHGLPFAGPGRLHARSARLLVRRHF